MDKFHSKIKDIQFDKSCSYIEAINTQQGKDAAFKLLMHLQWVAYNFESIRQYKGKLYNLTNECSSTKNFVSEYTNKVELTSGMPALNDRLDLLIKIIPRLIPDEEFTN